MKRLFKNPKVIFLIFLLIGSLLLISLKGIEYGIDFKGGTLFQIHLAKPVTDQREIESLSSTIEQRLDWTGLKDASVSVWASDVKGVEFIIAQIAETDPDEVETIKNRLLKQGKLEVILDGNVVFDGSDILQINKEPTKGWNFSPVEGGKFYKWTLPFTLTAEGAQKFTKATFHKCVVSGYEEGAGPQYSCEKTYFFIDRPAESVLVVSRPQFEADRQVLLQGEITLNIPQDTKIDELMENSALPYLVVDSNLTATQLEQLTEWQKENKFAVVSPDVPMEIQSQLESLNYIVDVFPIQEGRPWVWSATGVKNIISLSEDVTNVKPYVANVEEAASHASLIIRGFSGTADQAKNELNDLTILLESGSLPVPVESISDETITPFLGREFLFYASLIALGALIIVSLIIFARYRLIKLVLPIIFTAVSEVILVLGFAALISWRLDLAAVTGILAAVGTGVDDQIIITDELSRKKEQTSASLLARIKSAFFIIFAAAATTIATMSPIIMFSFGMGKLVGFAITTIAGVLIGIFLTRPAYSEIVKRILEKDQTQA